MKRKPDPRTKGSNQIRVTFRCDRELHRTAKGNAVRRGVTLSELFRVTLEKEAE